MRRLLFLLLLLAALQSPAPLHAQATADQLNKLSLEALTARPSGGDGGYARRGYRAGYHRGYRPRGYHGRVRTARVGHYGAYRRSYGRAVYARHGSGRAGYRFPARAGYHRPYRR